MEPSELLRYFTRVLEQLGLRYFVTSPGHDILCRTSTEG